MGKRTIVNVMLLTLTIFSLGLTWFIAPSAIPATANTNVLYVKGESVLNENPNLEKNLKTHAKNWQLMAKVPVVGSLAKDKLDELTQGVTKGVYPYWPTVWLGASSTQNWKETIHVLTVDVVAQPAVWFPVLTIAVLLALGTTFIIVYAADRNIFGLTIFNRTVSLLVVMFSFWAAKIILDNYYLYSQSWLVTFIEFIGVILVSLTLLMFNSYWYTVKLYRTYRIPVPVRKSLLTQNFVTFLTGSAIAIFVLVTLGWTPGLTGVKTGFLYVTILLTTVYLTKTYTTVSQLFSLNKKVNVLN